MLRSRCLTWRGSLHVFITRQQLDETSGTGFKRHDVRGVCNDRGDASGPCAVIKYCVVMRVETGTAFTVPVNRAGGNNNVWPVDVLSLRINVVVNACSGHSDATGGQLSWPV